ncbi:hypothetical protein MAQ58_02250 [Enterobacter sp. DRP3]|nr:hypothetical protein [Enterobacter sp. DRP3]
MKYDGYPRVMSIISTRVRNTGVILAAMLALQPAYGESIQSYPQPELPVCTVSAGGGHIDFGKSSRGQLQDISGMLSAGSKTITVNADCTLSRAMQLRINGLARGTAFSWGQTDSILKIHISQALLDGTPVQLQKTGRNGERSGGNSDRLSLLPGDTIQPVRSSQPVSGKHLTATLEIEAIIGDKDSRPVQQALSETSLNIALLP